MIKRTIEISSYGVRVSVRNCQVLIHKDEKLISKIPAEDIGILIIDSRNTTYTHGTLMELMEAGAIIVLCGEDHLPAAMVTPCTANSLQTARLAAQVNASTPLKKRLWQQIVREKIRNQARALDEASTTRKRLLRLAEKVRSGDPDNVEAHAARLYWADWLEDRIFRRRRNGEPPNNLLNYGYTILRAVTARAIVGAGLHPSIGIHHRNRFDAFCLADDLMEPLRPLIDLHVRELFLSGFDAINKSTKRELLSVLMEPVELCGTKGPLFVELEKTAASLVKCFEGEEKKLDIPKIEV